MAGEAEIKALDKRVGGTERKLEELDKSLRAAGDFKALEARVKALEASVKTLEAICKTLMEARTASKAEAAKMIADVAVLNKQSVTPETVNKLIEQERKAAQAAAIAQAKAVTDQAKAQGDATTRRMIEEQYKAVVEVRLKVLEAKMDAALAKR